MKAKPIETAPKGERILMRYVIGPYEYWTAGELSGGEWHPDDPELSFDQPTHWMLLPEVE